jgi:hypothetical protein
LGVELGERGSVGFVGPLGLGDEYVYKYIYTYAIHGSIGPSPRPKGLANQPTRQSTKPVQSAVQYALQGCTTVRATVTQSFFRFRHTFFYFAARYSDSAILASG